MIPFGKQQEICAMFRRQVQKICQETAGRLLIEDGVVVITNENSAVFINLVHLAVKLPTPSKLIDSR